MLLLPNIILVDMLAIVELTATYIERFVMKIKTIESSDDQSYVPTANELYIPFGNYTDIKTIIKSGVFYPVFITGLSGNGKTLSVEQSCASLNREMFRVNVTVETDEDDLFGGFRLIAGETVWFDGPVIQAMKRGAILLLDEIDLASSKALCLQPVLEGKGILLKKVNQFVRPLPGFNIIATANTKGKGSEDGRFIGTNVLNEAFLERFSITLEQEYPNITVETKIMKALMHSHGENSPETDKFIENLVQWSDLIRQSYINGAFDELISTRRLVHIGNAYAIFQNEDKAVKLCINRFDDNTKAAFLSVYKKICAPTPEEIAAMAALTEKNLENDSPLEAISNNADNKAQSSTSVPWAY